MLTKLFIESPSGIFAVYIVFIVILVHIIEIIQYHTFLCLTTMYFILTTLLLNLF